MKRILIVAAFAAAIPSSQADVLGTGASANIFYGGSLFDLKVGASNLTLTGNFSLNVDTKGTEQYRVYVKSGSYVGSESTLANWTLLGEASAVGQGANSWTSLSLGKTYSLSAGQTYGVAVFHVGGPGWATGEGGVGYRSSTGTFSDSNLTIKTGAAKGIGDPSDPFNIHTLPGRTWSGQLEYRVQSVPEPASMLALAVGGLVLARRRKARS